MMSRYEPPFDWHRRWGADRTVVDAVDSRPRMRTLLLVFGGLTLATMARYVQLETSDAPQYRQLARRPDTRTGPLPARRGRILARDGTPLAEDAEMDVLAIHYRYLETPADPAWLRQTARHGLPAAHRSNAALVDRAVANLQLQIDAMHQRLARHCGLSTAQWNARCRRVQQRVQRISRSVNRRRGQPKAGAGDFRNPRPATWSGIARGALVSLFEPPPALQPARITVKEELEFHAVFGPVPRSLVREFAHRPQEERAIRIDSTSYRRYPLGDLAAHLVGYVGTDPDAQPVGRSGMERLAEATLHGRPGEVTESFDRDGNLLASQHRRRSQDGNDLQLTLDVRTQRAAEQLLDDALRRRDRASRRDRALGKQPVHAGGAVVVVDIATGQLLAAASAPRFDPAAFSLHDQSAIGQALNDPQQPMFDRCLQMALPPGSVFKVVSAIALLETRTVDPAAPLMCQGYVETPDRRRCQLFVRYGVGHGPTTLADALVQSCNVYFFHYADTLGGGPLASWAARFGFGQRTGIELPGEATGHLPTPREKKGGPAGRWSRADSEELVIGQSTLTATPLQVARMMAAVANDGWLSPISIVWSNDAARQDGRLVNARSPARQKIPGLDPNQLSIIRQALTRVVRDPGGTAYDSARLAEVPLAGKTGTAQTGRDRDDHAWFAGYAPADSPKVALAVVVEHGGSGGTVAAPIAQQLVRQMWQDGALAD